MHIRRATRHSHLTYAETVHIHFVNNLKWEWVSVEFLVLSPSLTPPPPPPQKKTTFHRAPCNSLFRPDYFKRFCFEFLESYASIFDLKISSSATIEKETALFHSLGIQRVTRRAIPFTLDISVITSPTKRYLYQLVSCHISEVVDKKTAEKHLCQRVCLRDVNSTKISIICPL